MYAIASLIIIALILLIVKYLSTAPYAARQPLPNSPIVDMHCHTAGVGAGDSPCFVSSALRDSWKFNVYLKIFDVSEHQLTTHGDAFMLERLNRYIDDSKILAGAVILALDGAVNNGELDTERTEVYVDNRFVGEHLGQFPKLHFGASVNPYRANALDELDWSVAHGAVLLKWLPSIQLIDPADEAITPFYERLATLGLPLLTHVGHENSFTKAEDELADPIRLELPLKLGVTVIAAHVATSGENDGECNVSRLLRLVEQYPNLYADISATTQCNRRRYLKRILSHRGLRGRLLYGSDFPLINTPMVTPWQYLFQLSWRELWSLHKESNPFDRDLRLKQMLGMPADLFAKPAELLRLAGVETDAQRQAQQN